MLILIVIFRKYVMICGYLLFRGRVNIGFNIINFLFELEICNMFYYGNVIKGFI